MTPKVPGDWREVIGLVPTCARTRRALSTYGHSQISRVIERPVSIFSPDEVTSGSSTTQTNLYRIMPLHETIALEHRLGQWSNALEFRAADRDTEVDTTRLEPQTPGYSILNLRTAYEWQSVRFDFAISNLLDRQYENPLGGTWQSALYPPGFLGATFRPLPAAGRSFDTGVTVKF
jgi:iron complex outermembrane recepter protein